MSADLAGWHQNVNLWTRGNWKIVRYYNPDEWWLYDGGHLEAQCKSLERAAFLARDMDKAERQ